MVSFSVNSGIDSKEKIKKVAELVKEMNEYNAAYIGDAFLKIAQGYTGKINLDDFAEKQRKAERRKMLETETLISQEELAQGHTGVVDAQDPIDYESQSIDKLDLDSYVEDFLSLRQFIFFKEGWDIWRMLKLIRSGDPMVSYKFRMIVSSYGATEFFKEFCSNIEYVYAVEKILH